MSSAPTKVGASYFTIINNSSEEVLSNSIKSDISKKQELPKRCCLQNETF